MRPRSDPVSDNGSANRLGSRESHIQPLSEFFQERYTWVGDSRAVEPTDTTRLHVTPAFPKCLSRLSRDQYLAARPTAAEISPAICFAILVEHLRMATRAPLRQEAKIVSTTQIYSAGQ